MNTQTAAALRALEQKWRSDSIACLNDKHGLVASEHYHTQGEGYALGECADELAAVLTQEWADIPVPYELLHELWAHCDLTQESGVSAHRQAGELLRPFHEARGAEPLFTASMYGTAADADKARDAWRAAQSEPRAAEGAGPGVNFICLAKFGKGEACTHPLCHCKREEPTAAAAVTAGGDAVAWLIEHRPGSCAPSWYSGEHRVGCDVLINSFTTESTKAIKYLTRSAALYALTMLRIQVAELNNVAHLYVTEHEWTAPAPRGGVAEAMVEDAWTGLRAWQQAARDLGVSSQLGARVGEILGLPPAAQAQDAGEPK